jgi:hypothetical protein
VGRFLRSWIFEEVDDVLHAPAVDDLLLLREPPVDERAQHAGFHVDVPAQHEVVEHGHAAEERDVLEGARHAQLGDLARRQVGDVALLERDAPRVRMVEAADHVQQARLPRPVRPDDRKNVPFRHVEAHAGDRLDTAERLADVANLDQRAHDSHRLRRR